jgi:hypothetical protein
MVPVGIINSPFDLLFGGKLGMRRGRCNGALRLNRAARRRAAGPQITSFPGGYTVIVENPVSLAI